MMKTRKTKANRREIERILEQIRTMAPPETWPLHGLSKEEVVERCRQTREQLWEEKLARHASRARRQ